MKALEILKELHNEDIWELHNLRLSHIQINEAIAELEEAMKPKTCEGCIDEIISSNRCEFCIRTHPQDFYIAKDNA